MLLPNAKSAAGMPFRKWERWFVAALFVLALGIRLACLYEARHSPFFEHPRLDALFHDEWAKSIAEGNHLGDHAFFRAPFYPYFLGLIYSVFGRDYVVPRLVQHLLGALAVVLLFVLTRRLFGSAAAVAASAIMALYAVVIYFEGELLFESILLFLCLLWFVLFGRAQDRPTSGRWLLAGVLYGIICATRPLMLPLFIPLLGFLFRSYCKSHGRRKALTVMAALSVGTILPILPITVRNYLVANDFVLIASQGGINFYIGNNAAADGHSSMMPGPLGTSWESRGQSFFVEQQLGHKPAPSEESWFWYKKGLQFIVEHPLHSLQLLLKKFYLFWNRYEIPNNQSFYDQSQYSAVLRAFPVGFWAVGPLGLLGMAVAWAENRARFPIMSLAFYVILVVMFFVCDRYRLPIVPFMCMFAGYAVVVIAERIRKRDIPWIAKHTLLGAALAFLVNSDLYGVTRESHARHLFALGLIAIHHADYSAALEYFSQCETRQPAMPNLSLNMGVAEWMRGNEEKAAERFRRELARFPDSYGALANLARMYLDARDIDSAFHYGELAIEKKPYVPLAYITVAQTHMLRREKDSAIAVLQRGLRMCGNQFLYGEYLLAGTSLERGDLDSAESRYRSIVKRLERFPQPEPESEFHYSVENKMGIDRQTLRARALYGIGHVFVLRNNLDSASTYFRNATEMSPGYSDAWVDLGVSLLRSRRFDEAETAFREALKFRPDDFTVWYDYGTLLGTTNRLVEARGAFEKSLALCPDFVPAKEKLAVTLKLLENLPSHDRHR